MCREEGTYCMAIIKQYHRDTDTTYVYESTSYWDAEKGQSRSKRRVIGKIDPGTGEIVPTGKRGRSKKTQPDQMKEAVLSGFESPADEADRGQILQLELSVKTGNTGRHWRRQPPWLHKSMPPASHSSLNNTIT